MRKKNDETEVDETETHFFAVHQDRLICSLYLHMQIKVIRVPEQNIEYFSTLL